MPPNLKLGAESTTHHSHTHTLPRDKDPFRENAKNFKKYFARSKLRDGIKTYVFTKIRGTLKIKPKKAPTSENKHARWQNENENCVAGVNEIEQNKATKPRRKIGNMANE
jgi:hypothetical protein